MSLKYSKLQNLTLVIAYWNFPGNYTNKQYYDILYGLCVCLPRIVINETRVDLLMHLIGICFFMVA